MRHVKVLKMSHGAVHVRGSVRGCGYGCANGHGNGRVSGFENEYAHGCGSGRWIANRCCGCSARCGYGCDHGPESSRVCDRGCAQERRPRLAREHSRSLDGGDP